MNSGKLERRVDIRTHAFEPISIHVDGTADPRPAHLLDLSTGGAGIMTTAYNSPQLGDYIDLQFDGAKADGGTESPIRNELGVVVNLGSPERGVRRIGVRFLESRKMDSGLFAPIDDLSWQRRKKAPKETLHRWESPRRFAQPVGATPVAAW